MGIEVDFDLEAQDAGRTMSDSTDPFDSMFGPQEKKTKARAKSTKEKKSKASTELKKTPNNQHLEQHSQVTQSQEKDFQQSFKQVTVTVEAKHVSIPTPPIEIRRAVNHRQWNYSLAWVESASAEIAYKTAGYTIPCTEEQFRAPLQTGGVRAAIDWILSEVSKACKLSVEWVQQRLVRIYDSSMESTPIYSARGKLIGHTKRDFGAALRAVELAGKSIGMFKTESTLTVGGEIKHLLLAVGARGKPSLEHRRAERVVAEVPKGAAKTGEKDFT